MLISGVLVRVELLLCVLERGDTSRWWVLDTHARWGSSAVAEARWPRVFCVLDFEWFGCGARAWSPKLLSSKHRHMYRSCPHVFRAVAETLAISLRMTRAHSAPAHRCAESKQ